MLEESRLAQNTREMNIYKLNLLGITEMRWNESGEHLAPGGELLLYSGKSTDARHESETGLIVSKKLKRSLIEWNPVSDRILLAQFTTRLRKLTVIICYAPIDTSAFEDRVVL